jgi:prolyl-tRNA synthetase
MFADADLIGVPIRVVVSPRNLKEGKIEISTRDKSVSAMVDVAEAGAYIRELKEKLFAEINQ